MLNIFCPPKQLYFPDSWERATQHKLVKTNTEVAWNQQKKKKKKILSVKFRSSHYAVKRATVESFIINDLIYQQHISSLKATTILNSAR